MSTREKEKVQKLVNKEFSDNTHLKRTIEKNKLFKEDKTEERSEIVLKESDKFENYNKICIRNLLEKDTLVRKMQDNSKMKGLEMENQILMNIQNK